MSETKAKHGGARPGSGRPRTDPGRGVMVSYTVSLYQDMWDFVDEVGGGDTHAGLRHIIDKVMQGGTASALLSEVETPPEKVTGRRVRGARGGAGGATVSVQQTAEEAPRKKTPEEVRAEKLHEAGYYEKDGKLFGLADDSHKSFTTHRKILYTLGLSF